MHIFFHVVTNNVMPLFVIILLGYLLRKKFAIDINSLSKAYFYVFLPAFLFKNLYSTDISSDMLRVLAFMTVLFATSFVVCSIIGRFRKFSTGKLGAFSNAVMFFNSGNMGLPLITLVFTGTPYLELAVTAQITVLVFQNVTTTVFGILQAARANFSWKVLVKKIVAMPTLWVILGALLLRLMPIDLQTIPVIWAPITYASNGLISLALLTLGVQLGCSKFSLSDKDVYLATGMRLVVGPILAVILLILLQIKGPLAHVLMIAASVPTAVNTALIAVEFDNESDFASQIVLTSTAFSAVSLALVISLAGYIFPI